MKVRTIALLSLLLICFLVVTVSAKDTVIGFFTEPTTVCSHIFTKYVSDKNATCFADGTKTALCDNGCGKTNTVSDPGTKAVLKRPAKLTAQQTTTQIKLTWSEVSGATGYSIYYKTADKWKKYGNLNGATSYTFKNLKPGFKVRFAIKPYAKSGDKVINCAEYTEIYTATKNSAPEKVAVQQSSSQIKLSWTACKGADGYRIYYMKKGSWTVATSYTKETSVTYKNLPAAKNYTLAVRPVLKAGSVVFGDYKTVTTSTKTKAPQVKVTIPSKGKVEISWSSVTGAEGYQLYYRINNGAYKHYKNYNAPQKLSFNLKGDASYLFAVRGYKKVDGKILYGEYLPVGAHIGSSVDRVIVNPSQGTWNLVLVNKQRELPSDFSVKLDYIADGYRMDSRASVYFNKMYDAAEAEGIYLTPVSAYRSNAMQKDIFNETVEDYMYDRGMSRAEAEKKTGTEVLPPGTSEHNLGLAVDIGSVDGYFEDSEAYVWLRENAHKYGFIERYTKEKQSITGIIPEPWHWRFVGVEYATKIKQSGLCLEEYLAKYNLIP